jgi:5'-methylthioadenosine phosphorylase
MPGLENVRELEITTPFGKPSAALITGMLEDLPVVFLARHGLGHYISPSEVNYRANVFAMKTLGVERILSISACGSLREDYAPGEIIVPDQLFDFTRDRKRSFFGEGIVAHISTPEPFCPDLSAQLYTALLQTEAKIHRGGAMITIEGPRFSTRAESNVFRSWGMALIGMTTSPEAFLAREAELCYTVMAHVTDFDVWHISEEPVTVERVVEILNRNTQVAQQALRLLASSLAFERKCSCGQALETALITHPESISSEAKQRLGLLIEKYVR